MHHLLPEVAHQIGLLPLLWLVVLRWRGVQRGPEWWWIAAAFGISWVADTVTHILGHPWLVSAVYPVSQTGIIAAVLLPRSEAVLLTLILVAVAIMGLLAEGTDQPQLLLHSAVGIAVVGVLWERPPSRLRAALLLGFGLNLIPWMLYALRPTSWALWEFYQGIRALSLGWFCWAASASHQQAAVN